MRVEFYMSLACLPPGGDTWLQLPEFELRSLSFNEGSPRHSFWKTASQVLLLLQLLGLFDAEIHPAIHARQLPPLSFALCSKAAFCVHALFLRLPILVRTRLCHWHACVMACCDYQDIMA
jgi:hypothetical protein